MYSQWHDNVGHIYYLPSPTTGGGKEKKEKERSKDI